MTSAQIDALDVLVKSSRGSRASEVKTALTRLSTEIHCRVSRASDSSLDFVQASVRVLARIKGRGNAELRMTCFSDSSQYLFSNGRSKEALFAAAHCENLARLTRNDSWLARAQSLQSAVNAELGNVAEAVVKCSSALDIARKSDDVVRESIALVNMGVALNYGGLFEDAIPCLERAFSLLRSERGISEASRLGVFGTDIAWSALSNKAWSHFELAQVEEALAVMEKCLRKCPEPWDPPSAERRATRECMYVNAAVHLKKFELAREHAERSARYGDVSDRARFYSKLAHALYQTYGGDSEIGISGLESLLQSSNSKAQQHIVLSALIRAYDHHEMPEPALERVQALISLVRAQREAGMAVLFALNADMPRQARDNLSGLTAREASLRARVIERRLLAERVEVLERFAVAADLKEEESGRHGYRVGCLAKLLAEGLCWKREATVALELAARLHDIGKIAIPDRILLASQELQAVERRIMSTHTIAGAELLSNSNMPQLRMAEEIARHHHEWWDGTGYPSKLSGKRIPVHARIVALADVFDALTHGRPYAPAWPIDRALEEIRQRRGTQFDPDLTDTFLALVEELRREHPDLDAYLGEASRNSPFLQARDKIRLMLEGERQAENIAAAAADTVH